MDECNDIPAESVLTSVRVKRVMSTPLLVSVPLEECQRVDDILLECRHGKKNGPSSIVKKAGTRAKRGVKKVSLSPKKVGKPKVKAEKRKRASTDKAVAAPRAKKQKVTCYPNVEVYEINPLYDPTFPTSNIPKVAPSVDSLLYVRAAKNKKYSEVLNFQDVKKSFSSSYYTCNDGNCNKVVSKSAWHYAVDNRDRKMIKLLNDETNEYERIEGTRNYLSVS